MINIRKNSDKYRIWKTKRNRRDQKRRIKIARRKRNQRTSQILRFKKISKIREIYNQDDNPKLVAPKNFSIVNNENETIKYFNDIIDVVKEKREVGKVIWIDLYNVEKITTDAIMYLIAIITNIKNRTKELNLFQGSSPRNKKANEHLLRAGFYRYVRSKHIGKLPDKTDGIQIEMGNSVVPDVAKSVCRFATKAVGKKEKSMPYLYEMLIELMANTKNHAYKKKDKGTSFWFIYVEKRRGKLKFFFLDTGEGIAKTVFKKFHELIGFRDQSQDADYIKSTFLGKARTQTRKKYRGLGLPEILNFYNDKYIDKLSVIANRGKINFDDKRADSNANMVHELNGTIIYWEIDIKKERTREH